MLLTLQSTQPQLGKVQPRSALHLDGQGAGWEERTPRGGGLRGVGGRSCSTLRKPCSPGRLHKDGKRLPPCRVAGLRCWLLFGASEPISRCGVRSSPRGKGAYQTRGTGPRNCISTASSLPTRQAPLCCRRLTNRWPGLGGGEKV